MNKYTNTILALLLASTFMGCNSSNDTETKEEVETNTSTAPKEETPSAVQTEEQVMPQCYIAEGTPKTDSSVVVHVKCRNGNIPIDEASVRVDGKTKSVDYVQVDINDYIGFQDLQPDTLYKVQLEVVVGGETITKSVKIRTNKEVVKATPTPTPTPDPIIDTPPQWTKDSYELYLRSLNIPSDNTILDLNELCSAQSSISYKITSSSFQQNNQPTDVDYNFRSELIISSGKLKLSKMPFNGGVGIVEIRATANDKSSYTNVEITFEPLYLP